MTVKITKFILEITRKSTSLLTAEKISAKSINTILMNRFVEILRKIQNNISISKKWNKRIRIVKNMKKKKEIVMWARHKSRGALILARGPRSFAASFKRVLF